MTAETLIRNGAEPVSIKEVLVGALRAFWSKESPDMPGFTYPQSVEVAAAWPTVTDERPCGIFCGTGQNGTILQQSSTRGSSERLPVNDGVRLIFNAQTNLVIVHIHPEAAASERMAFRTALFIEGAASPMLECELPGLKSLHVVNVGPPTRGGSPDQGNRSFTTSTMLLAEYEIVLESFKEGLLLKRVMPSERGLFLNF